MYVGMLIHTFKKNRVDMTRVDATLKKALVPGSDVENVTLLIFNSRAVTSLSPPPRAQGCVWIGWRPRRTGTHTWQEFNKDSEICSASLGSESRDVGQLLISEKSLVAALYPWLPRTQSRCSETLPLSDCK